MPDARNREEDSDVRGEESDVRDARDRGPNYYLPFRELEAAGPHLPLQRQGEAPKRAGALVHILFFRVPTPGVSYPTILVAEGASE